MTSLIAEKLGRTENAVRWIIRSLDIPLTEKYRPWTEVEKKDYLHIFPTSGWH